MYFLLCIFVLKCTRFPLSLRSCVYLNTLLFLLLLLFIMYVLLFSIFILLIFLLSFYSVVYCI